MICIRTSLLVDTLSWCEASRSLVIESVAGSISVGVAELVLCVCVCVCFDVSLLVFVSSSPRWWPDQSSTHTQSHLPCRQTLHKYSGSKNDILHVLVYNTLMMPADCLWVRPMSGFPLAVRSLSPSFSDPSWPASPVGLIALTYTPVYMNITVKLLISYHLCGNIWIHPLMNLVIKRNRECGEPGIYFGGAPWNEDISDSLFCSPMTIVLKGDRDQLWGTRDKSGGAPWNEDTSGNFFSSPKLEGSSLTICISFYGESEAPPLWLI